MAIVTTVDAILYQGRVLVLDGEMPTVGYNPESLLDEGLLGSTRETEVQEWGLGARFRRDTYKNGQNIVRVTCWYIDNPPVVEKATPAEGKINAGATAVTIDGGGFGTDKTKLAAFLRYKPAYNRGVTQSIVGYNLIPVTIKTATNEQLTVDVDLDEVARIRMFNRQDALLVVQRVDLQLESDPLKFTLS